jgi:hypothetical protein
VRERKDGFVSVAVLWAPRLGVERRRRRTRRMTRETRTSPFV